MLRALQRPALRGAVRARFFSEGLRRTPLYELHKELGAETTGFGGWDMPLYYKDMGIMKEHKHCRDKAGLFDVSHMVPVRIHGANRVPFAQRLLPADVESLAVGQGALSWLANEDGGMIDDLIITNLGDQLHMVINAGHEDKDIPHMQKYLSEFDDVSIQPLPGRGLLALQGPSAPSVLASMCDEDMSQWKFMTGRDTVVGGVKCFVTRSGYTGEDGFEIMCEGADAEGLARQLLAKSEVEFVGLGARDSLRLEAGLCLYGNDMDETTTPVEATLTWTIPKSRRKIGGFVGAEKILPQIGKKDLPRARVGFTNRGPPARSHDKIFTTEGEQVGEITSGVYGPTVKHNCSMGYVEKKYSKKNTVLQVEVRGKMHPLVVTPMPFTPANFFRG